MVECGLLETAPQLLGGWMVVSEVGMEAVAFGPDQVCEGRYALPAKVVHFAWFAVVAHQFAIAADSLVLVGFAAGMERRVVAVAS